MYGYGYYPMFFDPTYILIIIGVVICLIASANVKNTYAKYDKVKSIRGYSASDVARMILNQAGLGYIPIEHVSGNLTDHYDPKNKVLRLSDSVYHSTSVAAIGVAAHECGHAIQDDVNYVPIRVRNAIVPIVNLGSALAWPLIILGILFSSFGLIELGIFTFSFAVIFQLITLPVEFNASRRAMTILSNGAILSPEECNGASKVLRAAALTYVTALLSSILQLLRLVLLFGRRNN